MSNTPVYQLKWCAQGYDDDRFGGSFGRHLHDREIETLLAMLDGHGGPILDVGAGTGKLSLPLLERGRRVISVDSSAEMLKIAWQKADERSLTLAPTVCDIHHLCFADDSFECVVCSRVLMHLSDWRASVSELCRVARCAVVVDFPPVLSFAGVNGRLKALRGLFDRRIRGYRALSTRKVLDELERNGYGVVAVRKDYFLPVALHRSLNRPRLSLALERVFRALGLVRLLGAPVTVKAVRRGAPALDPAAPGDRRTEGRAPATVGGPAGR